MSVAIATTSLLNASLSTHSEVRAMRYELELLPKPVWEGRVPPGESGTLCADAIKYGCGFIACEWRVRQRQKKKVSTRNKGGEEKNERKTIPAPRRF